MKIQFPLLAMLIGTAVSLLTAFPAWAGAAYLVGQQEGSRVNVRSAPSTNSPARHYGLVGDRVQVIKSTTGNDGYLWYYVEFPSGARGWIRGDFVEEV